MFGKTEVNLLFPTCIWKYEVTDFSTLNSDLMSGIQRLRDGGPSASKELGTWQSAGDLNTRPEFKPFMEMVIAAVSGVFEYLRIQSEGIVITNCWATITQGGFARHSHTHPNNLLSGVYHVKAPSESGNMSFKDPRPQAEILVPAYKESTPHNSAKHSLHGEEGTLLLFPSWLEHTREAQVSEEECVSMAFNAVPKGRLGNESGRLDI